MDADDVVEFTDVQVEDDLGLALVCLVGGKRVSISRQQILAGSTVRCPGGLGKLVIRRWLAKSLGLI
jgi:hypothetical protein